MPTITVIHADGSTQTIEVTVKELVGLTINIASIPIKAKIEGAPLNPERTETIHKLIQVITPSGRSGERQG